MKWHYVPKVIGGGIKLFGQKVSIQDDVILFSVQLIFIFLMTSIDYFTH